MAKSLFFRCVSKLVIGWTWSALVFGCGPSKDPNNLNSLEAQGDFLLVATGAVPNGATWIVSDGFAIDFVYSHEEMFDFDIVGYLQSHSPHRLYYAQDSSETSYAETISHFAGKEGISPRFLIALMELKSDLISDPRPSVQRPFGDLSHETGFVEQIRDVTARLTALRFPDVLSTRSRSTQTTLEGLLSADEIARLDDVYQTLFPGVISQRKVFQTRSRSAVVDPTLQFPYPIGNDKWSFNGTHAPGMASIDFARWESWGDVIVDPTVASGSGKVKVHSSCSMTIIHDEGWSTFYYHMDKLIFNTGDTVNVNEPIGYYAANKAQALCDGGSSTGPHVHWTLRKDGSAHSLLDVVLSGWTFHPGRYDYDSDCQQMYAHRDGKKWCAYRDLLNEGAGCIENSTRETTCGIGACSGCEGQETCKNGKWVVTTTCDPMCQATNEACNDIDDDCDGTADEGLDKPTTCGVGACAVCTGVLPCDGSPDTCDPFCSASIEICNNQIDDDCDGSTDESECVLTLENLVLPTNGGVLESFTSEYGEGWVAADLTNGVTNEEGWASVETPSSPQEFVYSFRDGESAFLAEAVIHSGTAEGLYYSKDVEVWTSPNGSDFNMVASGTLAKSDNDSVTLYLKNTQAKKVKLRITSGYSSEYWELAEFVVKGAMHVEQTNTPPVAKEQSVSISFNTAKDITLQATDADKDSLTYHIVVNPKHGNLSGTAPNLSYTPDKDYAGSDSFTYKANDGKADSNTATVSITVKPAANAAPVAHDLNVTTTQGKAKAVTLSADDTDGDSLSFRIAAGPTHGTLSGTAPNVTYKPNADYTGSDSFTFVANDGKADSNTATVSITVKPAANAAPVAHDLNVSTTKGKAKAVTLSANDTDGDSLSFRIAAGPTHGTLSGTAPNVTYKPNADYTGSDSFTYVANDGKADSNTATVSITVKPAGNVAPVAYDLSVTTNQGIAKRFTLSAKDADGDSLTYRIATNPAHGTLSGTAPNLTYTPNADYIGTDSFAFHVHDGALDSNEAQVSITVAEGTGFDDIGALLGCRQSSGSQTWCLPLMLALLGLMARRKRSESEPAD